MKKLFIALLAALLLAFAACAAPQQETAAPEPAQSERQARFRGTT